MAGMRSARILGIAIAWVACMALGATAQERAGGSGGMGSGATDAAVSANTGEATFELPVALPPGPGGLVPPLSLFYASGQGDGALGVGWRITLGEIRCTARFGVPEDPANCPQFEYNGQLLLGPDAAGHYHTFVESFARIRRVVAPGGVGWEVTGPDGTSLFFGTTEDSRVRVGRSPVDPVAIWKLSEVRDVFDNAIAFAYDRSDPGSALLASIDYGSRSVAFFYEPRPDPIHDFPGGVERVLTRRLREIEVTSDGLVHQRLVLGYSAAGAYTTHRSRLVSVQRFGADCPAYPGLLAGCSSLPAQTFAYTDPGDPAFATPDGSQWLADPEWAWFDGSTTAETADVNGDGLPDRIVAECFAYSAAWPCANPGEGRREVYLNTGAGIAPAPDPAWSAALASLTWDAPLLRVAIPGGGGHLGADACKAIPASLPSGVFFNRRDANLHALDVNALEIAIDPECGAELQTIGVEAHWRVVDLNGDGRADLVASSRVGGVWLKLLPDPNAPHEYVEATGSAVFLNDGAGWQRAPSLETGLPILAAMEISDHYGSSPGSDDYDDCAFYGWWGRDVVNDFPPAICRQMLYFAVEFVELDGDGRLDILASVPLDARYLPAYETPNCAIYDKCVHNPDRTLAFVQRRNAAGDWEWARDARFDLLDPVTGAPLHHRHLVQSLIDVNTLHDVAAGSFFSMDEGFVFADLNADGLTDVAWRDSFAASGFAHLMGPSLSEAVMLNTGSGWCASIAGSVCADAGHLLPDVPTSATPIPGVADVFETNGIPALADVNGDGFLDYYAQGAGGELELHLFDRSAGASSWLPDASGRFAGGVGARFDRDGDGAIDILVFDGGTPVVGRSQSRLPDLLRRADNGRGGVIEYTYTTGAAQRDASLEAEAAVRALAIEPGSAAEVRFTRAPVVASVRTTGPNRAPATTTYAYARPAWCPSHRISFGYGLVRTAFADGSVSEQVYYQSHGRAGVMAEQTLRDGDIAMEHHAETWERVDPATVAGAWAGDGVSGFGPGEPTYVARVVSRTSSTEYGAQPGDASGAQASEEFFYDDAYGYNFVSHVVSTRPTATLETTRIPAPVDSERWLIGLVERTTTELPSRNLLLGESAFSYTAEGRLATRSRVNARRESGAAPGDPIVDAIEYDLQGNIARSTNANGHATEFCYAGNPGSLSWCDAPAADDGVLVATRDPLGNVERFDPHPVFGTPRATSSDYRDAPGARIEFDPFGRPAAVFVQPEGGPEVRVAETVYGDAAQPPYLEELAYPDATGGAPIRTLTIGDGFGGVWRTVEEVGADAGGSPRYRGVATWHDPTTRTTRATSAIACGSDEFCSALTGASEFPAVVTQRDALGRTVRVETPDGVALSRYARTDSDPLVLEPGLVEMASPPALDVVLTKNAKGDLVRRTLDGDRVVGVDECANASDPTLASLAAVVCQDPDRSLHGYQGGGSPEVIYDALAVADERWNDPRHRLLYHSDTLARIVEVEDPDAGIALTTYDAVGNLASTRDARGLERAYSYDASNRLVAIATPANEPDVSIYYRPGERQTGGEAVGADVRTFWYDAFGRLRVERVRSAGRTLTAIHTTDLLGRATSLRYHGLGPAIRYEYVGPQLERVCRGEDCADPDALAYVEAIEYDDLGRPTSLVFPGGTRTLTYTAPANPALDTRRLVGDAFQGAGSGHVSRAIESYDGLGNVEAWTTTSSLPGMSTSGSYSYDQRNRLASWTRDGESEDFGYDRLGNLVVHGGKMQQYLHETKPHAITERLATGARYAYDASGNVASITAPGAAPDRHFRFDSAGRLACIGSAPGGCDRLQVFYDAGGRRVREIAGDVTRRFLGDGLVATETADAETVYRIEVSVFGDRVASTSFTPPVLALDESILVGGREVSPWWLASLPASAALWLLAISLRGGLLAGVARRPAASGLVTLLVAQIAVPAPAFGGGGGYRVVHRWMLTDGVGNGVAVIDAAGEILRHTRFRPFGGVDAEVEVAGGAAGRRIYAGHPEQAETGLVQMQARWMDPASGTFLSVDPVVGGSADPQAQNGYSYARNNPVSLADPSGACIVCPPPYPPFLIDAPPDFPRGAHARYRVDISGRVFGGRWLFFGRYPPTGLGDPGRPLASQKFDLDAFGNPRMPMSPHLNGPNAPTGGVLTAMLGALIRGVVDLVIGSNSGKAWGGIAGGWGEGPTGGFLPTAVTEILWNVRESVHRITGGQAFKNGMHAWHAGSNAALAKALGLVGAPLILLAGVFHETPLDLGSFLAEYRSQGFVNHALDSAADLGANIFGLAVGYTLPRSVAVEAAIRYGNYIPGPGEPDPKFGGGGGRYVGEPSTAWGQYP